MWKYYKSDLDPEKDMLIRYEKLYVSDKPVPVLGKMPDGWIFDNEGNRASRPWDCEWICNNKSLFGDERELALLKFR